MPAIDELPEPLRTFYNAFQKGDLNTMYALYHPDAQLRDPGVAFLLGHTDLIADGAESIKRYYYQAFSNMPEAPVVKIQRFWNADGDVIVEYTEGMMTYLEVFSVVGGKIARQQVFWGSVPPAPLLRSGRH